MIAGLFLAIRCFFRALFGKPLPKEALVLGAESTSKDESKPVSDQPATDSFDPQSVGAVTLLSLLQKEGRLVDFLQESIDAYDDAQIGAAVRNIHEGCRKVLDEHCAVTPVLDGQEDSSVKIEPGFDPSRIRLIGNVTGQPPFEGLLRHHGWQVSQCTLPSGPTTADRRVVAAAEVELN